MTEANIGLPASVGANDIDEGQSRDGAPNAPEIVNTPPAKPVVEEPKKDEPAPEPKPDEGKVDEAKTDEPEVIDTEYTTYNDPAADSVVDLLKEAGVTAEESHNLFKDAVESGDMTKIDMAALTEKVGKSKASLIMIGIKDYYSRITAGVQESVNAVYGEVGGEANWIKVQTWAKAKQGTDPEFATKVKEFNQMIDLNKTSAAIAARELRALYEAAAGNSALETKQINGDQAASVQLNSEGITRNEYLAQVKEAHIKGDMAEVERLRTQRQLARNPK